MIKYAKQLHTLTHRITYLKNYDCLSIKVVLNNLLKYILKDFSRVDMIFQ